MSYWTGRTRSEAFKRQIRGENNPNAVLTVREVRKIKAALASGEAPWAIAGRYPVTPGAIYAIRDGRTWGWVKP